MMFLDVISVPLIVGVYLAPALLVGGTWLWVRELRKNRRRKRK